MIPSPPVSSYIYPCRLAIVRSAATRDRRRLPTLHDTQAPGPLRMRACRRPLAPVCPRSSVYENVLGVRSARSHREPYERILILAAARQKTFMEFQPGTVHATPATHEPATMRHPACSAKYTPQDLKSVRTVIAVRGDGGPQRLLILRPHDLIGTAGTRSRLEISPRDLARSKRLRSDLALASCLDALGCPLVTRLTERT